MPRATGAVTTFAGLIAKPSVQAVNMAASCDTAPGVHRVPPPGAEARRRTAVAPEPLRGVPAGPPPQPRQRRARQRWRARGQARRRGARPERQQAVWQGLRARGQQVGASASDSCWERRSPTCCAVTAGRVPYAGVAEAWASTGPLDALYPAFRCIGHCTNRGQRRLLNCASSGCTARSLNSTGFCIRALDFCRDIGFCILQAEMHVAYSSHMICPPQ